MEVQIAAVCKTKDQHLLALEEDYLKRFPPHLKVVIRELGGEKFLKHSSSEQQQLQSDLLSKVAVPDNRLILLDEGGKEFSTEGLANLIQGIADSGADRLVFAIGGPNGWTSERKRAASHCISLSKMTLPYQLARLVVIEQLYRCFTINANLPYHR